METWLLWVIVGAVLVIAELVTGTFYLLVLGVGAFAAAAVAWVDANAVVQAIVAAGVALGGSWWVHGFHENRRRADEGRSNFLDRGQAVVMEGWSNETDHVARVKYRGTSWDARVTGDAHPVPGSTLYIDAQDGSMLIVVAARPQ